MDVNISFYYEVTYLIELQKKKKLQIKIDYFKVK